MNTWSRPNEAEVSISSRKPQIRDVGSLNSEAFKDVIQKFASSIGQKIHRSRESDESIDTSQANAAVKKKRKLDNGQCTRLESQSYFYDNSGNDCENDDVEGSDIWHNYEELDSEDEFLRFEVLIRKESINIEFEILELGLVREPVVVSRPQE